MLFLQFFLLIIGFILLIKGADFFVDGASEIAKAFHIPSVVIGLTIVSMGTSLPELAVSVTSAVKGVEGIAIGNVVGSNIVNLMLVAGITCIIIPVGVEKTLISRDLPFSIIAALSVLLLSADMYFAGTQSNIITRADGIILLLFFSVYMYSVFKSALEKPAEETNSDEIKPVWKSILFTVLGLAGIIAGGQFTINSAEYIARAFGMSDRLIGLTIIAFGTSLPELIISIVAACKGENDIAMGNVVGSNIFNILFILGFSTCIRPLQVEGATFIDIAVLLFCSLTVLALSKPKLKLGRICGVIMVLIYALYTTYIFIK